MGQNIYDDFNYEIEYLKYLYKMINSYNPDERKKILSDVFYKVKCSESEIYDLYMKSPTFANSIIPLRTEYLSSIIRIDNHYFDSGISPLKFMCKFDDIFENYDEDGSLISSLIKEAIEVGSSRLYSEYGRSFVNHSCNGTCDFISHIFKGICNEYNVKCKKVKIYPGFGQKDVFYKDGLHAFNIVTINDEDYLVDLSFKQFFELRGDLLESIGCVGFPRVSPGTFALVDEERRRVSMEILNRGFVKLEEGTLKNYCDMFALSTRNVYYYLNFDDSEICNGKVFSTDYTDDDYYMFLFSIQDMSKYENAKSLTYVKYPVEQVIKFYK